MKAKDIITTLIGVIVLGVAGWVGFIQSQQTKVSDVSAVFQKDIQDKLAKQATQTALMKQSIEALASDNHVLNRLNKTTAKHWKIVSQHRDWINILMVEQGKDIVSWPDLE